MVHVAIIGTGDLAYGLAHLFATHNSALTGNSLEVTKPNLGKEGLFHDTNVPLADFDDALVRADILILAIPSHGLEKFIFANNGRLKNKILVDVTNGGEDLYSVLGKTSIRWVKAFNDIGAVDIMLHKSGKQTSPWHFIPKYPQYIYIIINIYHVSKQAQNSHKDVLQVY